MKKKVFLIVIFFINSISCIYSQSGWVQQASSTSTHLYSVHFINSNTGWICGNNGIILHTSNGGANWLSQSSSTNLPLYSIMFADANTGWAVGGYNDNNPLCYHSVMILRTTNGGSVWVQQVTGIGFLYNDLSVVDNQTAYTTCAGICCPPFCIASSGSVSKTSNSGQNWAAELVEGFHSVFFLDINNGWATAQRSSDVLRGIDYVYRTSNAGNTWQEIRGDTARPPFPVPKNIFFVNELVGYLYKRNLLKTIDGGLTWSNADSISTSNINYHYFTNKDTGWCSGNSGKIIRTNNGGTNWNLQNSSTTNALSSIHFVDAYTGWIVGSGGTILKTITGGLTSVNQLSSSTMSSFELYQNYPNPFNPTTKINFDIPRDARRETQDVKLVVIDITGKEISTLVNQKLNAGSYSVEFDGANYPSGIYYYKLTTDEHSEVRKMILIK